MPAWHGRNSKISRVLAPGDRGRSRAGEDIRFVRTHVQRGTCCDIEDFSQNGSIKPKREHVSRYFSEIGYTLYGMILTELLDRGHHISLRVERSSSPLRGALAGPSGYLVGCADAPDANGRWREGGEIHGAICPTNRRTGPTS